MVQLDGDTSEIDRELLKDLESLDEPLQMPFDVSKFTKKDSTKRGRIGSFSSKNDMKKRLQKAMLSKFLKAEQRDVEPVKEQQQLE